MEPAFSHARNAMHDQLSPIQPAAGLEVTDLPPADDIRARIEQVRSLIDKDPEFRDAYQAALDVLADWLRGADDGESS